MATPNAAKHHDLEQRLRNLEQQVKGLGSVSLGRKISPVFAMSRQESDGSMNMPATFTEYYDPDPVIIPAGYHKLHVIMAVAAGVSYPAGTNGNVTAQPIIRWNGTTIQSGDAINSGNGSVSVATAFWAPTSTTDVGEGTQWLSFELGIRAGRSGTTPTAGSGNWHMSASIIFLH